VKLHAKVWIFINYSSFCSILMLRVLFCECLNILLLRVLLCEYSNIDYSSFVLIMYLKFVLLNLVFKYFHVHRADFHCFVAWFFQCSYLFILVVITYWFVFLVLVLVMDFSLYCWISLTVLVSIFLFYKCYNFVISIFNFNCYFYI
jgi:hypothetical protein